MRKPAFVLALLACSAFVLTFNSCGSTKVPQKETSFRVILGDEQFEEYEPLLRDKRIALFSNHSGIVGDKVILSDGKVQYGGFSGNGKVDSSLIPFGKDSRGKAVTYGEHILDSLLSHGINVTAIFCPEHGFRGTEDAGSKIADGVDEKTGVPLLSLYEDESTHAPSAQDMASFDVLVVDMQDVGLRYYTYYIALYYLMDACAKNQKSVVILDRPNPNGFYVDGEILKEEFVSPVGKLPVPTVHGLTWGELAQMINGEGWLTAGKNSCNLTVIPCKNYTHATRYSLIRAPSPNIRDMRAVYLYASTCFFENTIVSVARGTEFPFEVYGSPYFVSLEEANFSFVPKSIPGATNPPFLGETCHGFDLRKKPLEEILSAGCDLSYLYDAYQKAKSVGKAEQFWGQVWPKNQYWIDLLSGSSKLREQIVAGVPIEKIKAGWQSDIERFKEQRKPYLLYDEAESKEGADYLVIVSKASPMKKEFTDKFEFVTVDTVYDDEKTDVEKNTYKAYLELQSALKAQGIEIGIDSSYRSVAEQERIMKDFTEKYGEEYARKTVAIPGTSEHHTGLAIDIVPKVDGEWKWENEDMMKLPGLFAVIHKELPKHGFILRYPKGKENVSGYSYEPWHIRYVADKKIAQEISDRGITLEEYKKK